jgi:hypothetical protein
MKHSTLTTLIILAAGIVIGLLLGRSCARSPGSIALDSTYVTTIIPGDSALKEVMVKVPYPVYRDTGSTRLVWQPVDTLAILADYHRASYYSDTITLDGNFLAIIRDSVNFNRITWRGFDHQNLRPQVIHSMRITTAEGSLRRFALGPGLVFGSETLYTGGILQIQDKHHNTITLQVYAGGSAPPLFGIGYCFGIPLKPFPR